MDGKGGEVKPRVEREKGKNEKRKGKEEIRNMKKIEKHKYEGV